jgi:hypothetical protein
MGGFLVANKAVGEGGGEEMIVSRILVRFLDYRRMGDSSFREMRGTYGKAASGTRLNSSLAVNLLTHPCCTLAYVIGVIYMSIPQTGRIGYDVARHAPLTRLRSS